MKKYDEEAIRRWFENADGTHVKRWLVTAILVGSVLAMVTVVASAATIYVPDAYPTIQQAVNNAIDGEYHHRTRWHVHRERGCEQTIDDSVRERLCELHRECC